MKNLVEFEKYPPRYKKLQNKFRELWVVPELKENSKHLHPINNLPDFLETIEKEGKLVYKNYPHKTFNGFRMVNFVCNIYLYKGRFWGIGEYF